jgi:hypothetical protein
MLWYTCVFKNTLGILLFTVLKDAQEYMKIEKTRDDYSRKCLVMCFRLVYCCGVYQYYDGFYPILRFIKYFSKAKSSKVKRME